MRAVIFEEFQKPLQVRDVVDPTPPRDGVVISVAASGLCRSDWHGWMGHDSDIQLPHVPGHEFAGRVAEVGADVTRWQVGDRVTVPFCVGCGRCETCAQGDLQICDHYFQPGFTAWGSFAEYVAIPHADLNLVQLPEEIAFDAAASLGCRMVTAFRAVVDQGRLQPDQWIAVFGCGGVGLSAVMIAKSLGAKVIGIDVQPSALQITPTRFSAKLRLVQSSNGRRGLPLSQPPQVCANSQSLAFQLPALHLFLPGYLQSRHNAKPPHLAYPRRKKTNLAQVSRR